MKDIKPYDMHKIGTSTYDINMVAETTGGNKKKKGGNKGKSKKAAKE